MADKNYVRKEYEDNAETKAADAHRLTVNASKPGDFVYSRGEFDYADDTKSWINQLGGWQKPGEYQFGMQQSLNDTISKILNGDKFSYDLNGDMLYQQYKDKYINQGKMAMMDTMGQAQAATGGYGNSYAQSVGQQAYQGHLQQLNDKVPELYQLALDKYNQDRQELYNQYGLLSDRDNTEYGRYRDGVSDAYNERDFLAGRVDAGKSWDLALDSEMWGREHTLHNDAVDAWRYDDTAATNDYWNKKNFGYGVYSDNENFRYTDHRNEIADDQWQKGYDLDERQVKLAEDQAAKAVSTGGNGGGGGGDDSYPLSAKEWNDISARCDEYIMNKDASGLKNYLQGLYNRGFITEDEYADFYEQFVPKVKQNTGSGGGGRLGIMHVLN
jgi:hypothetical protein